MNAMKVNLKKYMAERDGLNAPVETPGPFITISRQFGCGGDRLAQKLLKIIDERTVEPRWKYLSKQLIEESAGDLRLTSDRVEDRVVGHGMNPVTNIFSAFGTSPISDEKIIKTVKEIISNYAKKGRVIIVGRGGAAITQRIPNGMHIRLIAPKDWRVEELMHRRDLTRLQASEMITEMDQRRQLWTEHLSDKPFDNNHYDLVINCQKVKEEEMANMVLQTLEARKMIPKAIPAHH